MTEKEIDQKVLDEAMCPELSDDFFMFNNKKIYITALKIKYQKQFAKAFVPLIDSFAVTLTATGSLEDLTPSTLLNTFSAMVNNVDVLFELLKILCHNSEYPITDEELDNATVDLNELRNIIIQVWKKGGEFNKEIADFIELGLKTGRDRARTELVQMLQKAGGTSTSTVSSKQSAKTTATKSTKSTKA